MNDGPPKHGPRDVQALESGMLEANDRQIRRILAVVDDVSDPAVNKALLDSLRPRLASLKPVRPLRFARLLFVPLDPLTVPARAWRPADLTVPRSFLAPTARFVRSQLGDAVLAIEKLIAGRKADEANVITAAGELLWRPAAEIIGSAPPPGDWSDTGLPAAAWPPLAESVVAVLRRATRLRSLSRDQEIGALEPDEDAVADITRGIAGETESGRAMVARLVLLRSPQAARSLRRDLGSDLDPHDKAAMRRALDIGVEAVLSQMERDTGFHESIGHVGLADAGSEVRRVTTLLRELETNGWSAAQRPRLKAIRGKLVDVCQERFARGMRDGLIVPLAAAAAPADADQQSEFENCARGLRKLDAAARTVSGLEMYNRLLGQAAEAVQIAAEAGTLTPMRHIRLIEILAGPDAAEALYDAASEAE